MGHLFFSISVAKKNTIDILQILYGFLRVPYGFLWDSYGFFTGCDLWDDTKIMGFFGMIMGFFGMIMGFFGMIMGFFGKNMGYPISYLHKNTSKPHLDRITVVFLSESILPNDPPK